MCFSLLTSWLRRAHHSHDRLLDSDGWFIVFLYTVVLPSPTFIYWRADKRQAQSDSLMLPSFEEETQNPLGTGSSDSDDPDAQSPTATNSPKQRGTRGVSTVSTVQLARMQRQGREQRATIQSKEIEIAELQSQVQQLGGEVAAINATRPKNSNRAALESTSGIGAAAAATTEQASSNSNDAEMRQWDSRRPSQVLAIASLVQEGVLTEEMADKAKQTLELHVASELDSQQRSNEEARQLMLAESTRQRGRVAKANSTAFEAMREQLPTACEECRPNRPGLICSFLTAASLLRIALASV